MSRDIEATKLTRISNAISNAAGYKAIVRADIYASRIFFAAITSDYPWGPEVEGAGMINNPVPQCPGYNSNNDTVATFYNDNGTLKYMTQGNSTPVTTSYTGMVGNPSISGSSLFVIRNNNYYRYTISWSAVTSRSTDPLSGQVEWIGDAAAKAIHAATSDDCVIIIDDDGGFKTEVWTNVAGHPGIRSWSTSRFMFPKFVDYTDGGSERTMADLAIFSGALKINDTIFVYLSDCYRGSIVGAAFDLDTELWGDIFTAVPTDIQDSMCEFRVANAYTRNGTAYIVGQYRRTTNIGVSKTYSMILSSSDGRTFSLDRFSLVSNLGYRFHAVCGTDTLFLSHCNRVCYADITYTFDGVNGTAASKISIPHTSIKQYRDADLQNAALVLKAGDESLTFDPLISEENRVLVYCGYTTTSGNEDELYATYIIDKISRGFADGKRTLTLALVNETEWRLAGLSSPFYTEILSKSSTFADLTAENGELYCADTVRYVEDTFSVDFWQSEPHADGSITGINILSSGGVDYYQAGAYHLHGIKTLDLKDVLGLSEFPSITATTVAADLYGWSHNDNGGSLNDTVYLTLITRDPETGLDTNHYSTGGQWPNTYPTPAGGNDPLSQSIAGLTVGHKIVRIGMCFGCDEPTWFCPERVEITSGARIYITPDDGNTAWRYESGIGIRLPGKGRPYIMFSQRPFDAYNFKISATFNDTATIPNTGYMVGCGLVGLAENGLNYIVGRFNRSPDADGQFEIVKVRDGIETILAVGYNVYDTQAPDYRLMFEHIDGEFKLWEYDSVDKEWQTGLSYKWKASDGWMFTSQTAVKKCGIYGFRDAPKFRIPGFYLGSDQENESPSDGIPMFPGDSLTDFAASGEVEIGNSAYSYTAKVTPPSPARGPYQFRQSDQYGSVYGLENRYFNWTAATSLFAGKLIAADNGYTYIISSSLFQVGSAYNRSRHYSTNPMIANAMFSNSNRIYMVGGLTGIDIIAGEQEKHLHRSWCLQRSTGEIYCSQYAGSNGNVDATVTDLIEKICMSAGGKASFPGDVVVASQAVSGDYLVGSLSYAEGLDLRFDVPTQTTVKAKVNIVPIGTEETQLEVRITHLGTDNYEISLRELPTDILVERRQIYLVTAANKFRILFHDNFVTVYMNDRWMHTFSVNDLAYPVTTNVYLNGTFTATNIRLLELSDWREAIYIDLETDGISAISNIIQERPVEQFRLPDGSVSFAYEPTRDQLAQLFNPREHVWDEVIPTTAASDAIIYTASEVKSLQFESFAENFGFLTRIYRFPNLNVGAYRAAQVLLQRLYEQSIMHRLRIRPDIRLVPGDVYQVDHDLSGTGTNINVDVLLEHIEFVIADGAPTMLLQGRQV